MIYLDNAATSFPKAPGVGEAMAKFIAEAAANPGRAGHRMAVEAEAALDATRLALTRLINAPDPHRMVFAMNCTDALNMAIKGVLGGLALAPGETPHVITTVLEHNSVSRPLQALAASGAIELTRLPCDGAGFLDPQAVADAITPSTAMVVMTHASNVVGTIQDAASVGAICREREVLFCLDAAQTIGVLPIDIEALFADMLAFPGHKSLMGPTGTGGLYVGERCPEPAEAVAATLEAGELDREITRSRRMAPWREGGTGGDSSTPTQPTLFPYYLEGGTPNTVGIAGLHAGVQWVNQQPTGATLAHEQQLVQRITDRIADDERFTLLGDRDASRRVGTVSFNVQGMDAPDVGSILDDSFEIAVRPGLHCSPYCHRQFDTFPDGAVRVSPGAFNTEEEVDQLLEAVLEIAEMAG